MKSNRIFKGTIYNKNESYSGILIKAKNKKYLELENTKRFLSWLALEIPILQNENFMDETTKPYYIKKEELTPYISVETTVSLNKARKIHKKGYHK